MTKFKCYGCNSKNCIVEQDDDVYVPYACVHGWNGDTEWQEVEEEPNEEELQERKIEIIIEKKAKETQKFVDVVNYEADLKRAKEVIGVIESFVIPKWILDKCFKEYYYACKKHPNFPSNEFQMMCIIQEELGEAVQALNNFKHHQQGCIDDVQIELLHTIVTCIRTLKAINEKEDSR